MAETGSTGQPHRDASWPRAHPISHRHPPCRMCRLAVDDPGRPSCPGIKVGECCHTTGIWRFPRRGVGGDSAPRNERPTADRILRGHVSPKMANGFWRSRSAAQGNTSIPASAAADPGTWRHHLIWRITIHRLRIPRRARRPGGHLAGWHVAAAGQAVSSLADDFGETVVLILDYVGPGHAATPLRMTLRQ